MTSDVDILNRAASLIGARATATSYTDASPLAVNGRLHYEPLRQQLLRAAQWGFARKTLALTQLGVWTDNPPTTPQPWLYKYAYPADCLKVRYVIPTWSAPGISPNNFVYLGGPNQGYGFDGPSRQCRFLVSYDDSRVPTQPVQRVILSNVPNAIAVYTVDVIDPNMWDSLFQDAMVNGLGYKLVMSLAGNVKMKDTYRNDAMRAVLEARAADGNEAVPSSDSTPDWINVRYSQSGGFGDTDGFNLGGFPAIGSWWGGYDNMSWGA